MSTAISCNSAKMSSDEEQHHMKAIDDLRSAIQPALHTPDDSAYVNDGTLRRYLVARNWDVAGATKTLHASVEWRKSNVHKPYRCEPCESDPCTHCIVPIGWSTARHPIVWGCPARGKSGDGPSAVAHIVAALEHVFSLPESADQWVSSPTLTTRRSYTSLAAAVEPRCCVNSRYVLVLSKQPPASS